MTITGFSTILKTDFLRCIQFSLVGNSSLNWYRFISIQSDTCSKDNWLERTRLEINLYGPESMNLQSMVILVFMVLPVAGHHMTCTSFSHLPSFSQIKTIPQPSSLCVFIKLERLLINNCSVKYFTELENPVQVFRLTTTPCTQNHPHHRTLLSILGQTLWPR